MDASEQMTTRKQPKCPAKGRPIFPNIRLLADQGSLLLLRE
jgi:hypothetical protein